MKVKAITTQGTNQPLECAPGTKSTWSCAAGPATSCYAVANATFRYLQPLHLVAGRRMAAPQTPQDELEGPCAARYYPVNRWWPQDGGVVLFEPGRVEDQGATTTGATSSTPWPKLKETA